ncbi:MAG TPA: hypothetical protein VGQ09_19670 [Chitinophagaceae bacterium]|jgi:hypothetical protein|nr:hypothetical protein [Chitinophagaceae bacterium]
MHLNSFTKAGILTIVLVVVFSVCWELYWRSRGFRATFNDDKILWATKRKQIYQPANEATVFIGPSRIKFDLDVPTWEKLTGEKAVQLAIVGTSCRLILNDLAKDEKFKGKLIIDATEFTLFSGAAQRDRSATQTLDYYYKETPSQKTSSAIDHALESNLVFLEEGKFGLNSLLYGMHVPDRRGVVSPPAFPKEFAVASFERQSSFTPMFLSSEHLQNIQKNNWVQRNGWIKKSLTDKTIHGLKGDSLTNVFDQMKKAIDKIRSRGGQVLFVRPPSSGGYKKAEQIVYPREEYWDKLLAYTNTPGIYYEDYPEVANFICPEWSHLSPADAVVYTKNLVKILQEEKGWKFKQPSIFN